MTKGRKIISIYEGAIKRTLKVIEKAQEQINEMIDQENEMLEELQEYKSVGEEVGLPIKIIDRFKEMELERRTCKARLIEYSNSWKTSMEKLGDILEEIKKESQALNQKYTKKKGG